MQRFFVRFSHYTGNIKMYKRIIVLSLLAALISANITGWRNCGNLTTIFNSSIKTNYEPLFSSYL